MQVERESEKSNRSLAEELKAMKEKFKSEKKAVTDRMVRNSLYLNLFFTQPNGLGKPVSISSFGLDKMLRGQQAVLSVHCATLPSIPQYLH